jgi:hypothetical protein
MYGLCKRIGRAKIRAKGLEQERKATRRGHFHACFALLPYSNRAELLPHSNRAELLPHSNRAELLPYGNRAKLP